MTTGLAQRFKLPNPEPDEETPATLEELHAYVLEHYGLDVPRHSVCQGHTAPMSVLWALYDNQTRAALVVAARGSGKTLLAALLHALFSSLRPGHEGLTFGAIKEQSKRTYENLQKLLRSECGGTPDTHPEILKSIQSETLWRNGSRVEVITGSVQSVNGPHPVFAHLDELEVLEDPRVFEESRAMTQSANGYPALDLVTSTRKWLGGSVQALIDETADALKEGHTPPFDLFFWCIFEATARQDNCQRAYPDHPSPCKCDQVVKGSWDDQGRTPRTFADCCGGKLAHSDGWLPLADAHGKFMQNSRDVWESQFECSRPSTEGMVLPGLNAQRNGLHNWTPDPALGWIVQGIDWGGSNPHASIWIQVLDRDFEFRTQAGALKVLPAGSHVVFDSVYRAEISVAEFSDLCWIKELGWREKLPGWRVAYRFYDSQGKSARADFLLRHPWTPMLRNFIGKRVADEVGIIRELVNDGMLFIDVGKAAIVLEELQRWRYPETKGARTDRPEIPVADADHTIAALRYAASNVRTLRRKAGKLTGATSGSEAQGAHRQLVGHSPTPYKSGTSPYATHGAKDAPEVGIRDLREEALFQG